MQLAEKGKVAYPVCLKTRDDISIFLNAFRRSQLGQPSNMRVALKMGRQLSIKDWVPADFYWIIITATSYALELADCFIRQAGRGMSFVVTIGDFGSEILDPSGQICGRAATTTFNCFL